MNKMTKDETRMSTGKMFLRRFLLLLPTLCSLTALSQPTTNETFGLPTLFLIGDSTVKNGNGKGESGLWGWGNFLPENFDSSKIRVENRALGGRSSRTYLTEGLWNKVLADIKPGDFVMIQFGHNDGGELANGDRPRASLKGNGDKTRDVTIEKTGKEETVHSYGWYLRKYIADAKAKGATPIVLSPIPRNIWKGTKVNRASKDYAKWAAEAAQQGGAFFIPLNKIIADHYDKLGEQNVSKFFTPSDHTHTTLAGAKFNAAAVVEGTKQLKDCPLKNNLVARQK
jgi:rhamnogalacturonan acetylesterase